MPKVKPKSSLPLIIIFFVVVVLLGVGFFLFFDNESGGLLTADDQGEAFEDILINEEESNMEETNQQAEDFQEFNYMTMIPGEGVEAQSGDTVLVHYTGTLIDGTKFDSSLDRGQPFEFVLGQRSVIQGWELGVVGMQVGETRKLEIPSTMGYGEMGAGEFIPPNAGLVFEVELLEIK